MSSAEVLAVLARIEALEAWQNKTADDAKAYPFNSGDTAWMLTCTCLVLMMTIPGLALFYAGLSTQGNALSASMQSFAITCWVTCLWLMLGYSLAFGSGVWFIGGGEKFWFMGDSVTGKALTPVDGVYPLVGTVPEPVFCMFQLTFAIITSAIITGASAERMKFTTLLIFTFFWHLLVYCPICHWVWGGGFLHTMYGSQGVLDYAGGVSGLVVTLILGPRRGFSLGAELPPHNALLTFIGASFLWVGWFGFNAGSALAAGGSASMALLTTQLAAGSGGMAWMAVEWLDKGKPTVLGIVSGSIAGLVGITPGCGFVDQTGGFCIGVITGVICYFGIRFKKLIGADDALDAFGIHAVGGIAGGFCTGLFANPKIAGCGAFYGCPEQLGWQIAGILTVISYSAVLTAIIMMGLKYTIGIRVSAEDEDMGLDASEHGWNGDGNGIQSSCRSHEQSKHGLDRSERGHGTDGVNGNLSYANGVPMKPVGADATTRAVNNGFGVMPGDRTLGSA